MPNISALHTLQNLLMELKRHDVLRGMACHSSWRATVSSSRFLGGLSRFLTLSPSNAHTFSTGLMIRGLCRPVHHINPSISEEHYANSGSVWSSVVMLKHLYLWMVLHEWLHLLLQDFVPVPHSIEVPLDHEISMVPSRNPTPHHMRCTPSISVCFTDAWVCQSFVSSFPHSLSSINPLKHEPAFHLTSESDSEFDSESESGLSYPGAQRRNDKIWK